MKVRWLELDEFPDYAVSDEGEITNMKTGSPRKISINQQGIPKISMYGEDGRLITRSLSVIVATAFLPRPDEPHFNTPIHLDGDRLNCRADNLMWRPRWFAIKYHRQFHLEVFHHTEAKLVEVGSGEHYDSLKEACIKNGLHYFDVIKSYTENTFVFPTWQEFRLAN